MKRKTIDFPGFSVTVPDDWNDITDELRQELEDSPWTITNEDSGVGSLQFSVGVFDPGEAPRTSIDDLARMLQAFTEEQGLFDGFDRETFDPPNRPRGVSMSYRDGDDYYRVGYLSDGSEALLVTYTCDWPDRRQEASIVASVFESIRFTGDPSR